MREREKRPWEFEQRKFMALGALRVLCANNKIEMGSVFVHGEEAFQQGNSTGAAMNNLI